MRLSRREFTAGLLTPLATSVFPSLQPAAAYLQQPNNRRGPGAEAAHAMVVATTGPIAIREGVNLLQQGGSAADAVLATALAQIVLAAGSWVSFAGRMTAVYFDAKRGRVDALNACYDAPRQEADPLSIPRQGTPSGRTALVPGFLAGVQALHARYGRLPFGRLFQLAMRLADEGFELDAGMARLIKNRENVLTRLPATRTIFTSDDGRLFGQGERFRQPELAETLRQVAEQGAEYCYTGPWARRFAEVVGAEGGKISLEDLRQYRADWSEPLQTTFGNHQLLSLPAPNRGGPLALAAMNLADFAALDEHGHYTQSAESLDRVLRIEQAMRLIASGRGRQRIAERIGIEARSIDDFVRKEVGKRLWEQVASQQWHALVNPSEAGPKASPHSDAVVAVDPEGNVAAMLHTINTGGWGTTGIFVDGISIPDSAAFQQRAVLAAGPGGRIADHGPPALVMQSGKPVLACSATGSGNFIATWQHMINTLAFGMTPQQAAETPTFYNGTFENTSLPEQLVEEVRSRGTPLRLVRQLRGSDIGYWAGIARDPQTGILRGGKIRRLNGRAMGY